MKKNVNPDLTSFYNKMMRYTAAFIFFLCVFFALGFRINIEHSLDKGVYLFRKSSEIQRGDIIRFITSPEASKLALEREYIISRPFNKEMPIDTAKIVEGLPGDSYKISRQGVFVNDTLIPNSKPRESDSIGRPMPVLNITGVLKDDEYIVMSQDHPKGYDSRYYGHITKDMILGVGKKVF